MLTNEDQPSSELPALLFRNVITRAIGTHPYVLPDIGVIPIYPGDIYLLCSDGLTDFVPEETIAHAMRSSPSLEAAAHLLVNCALEKGGNDNVTVLLVKISRL
jgi:protein phosphatase